MSDTSLSSSSTASSSPSKDGITHRAGRNRLTQNHFLGSTFFGSNGGMAGSASFDPETSPSFAIRSGECKMTDDGKGASPGKYVGCCVLFAACSQFPRRPVALPVKLLRSAVALTSRFPVFSFLLPNASRNKMEVLHVDKDESTARSGADRGLPKLVDAFFDHYCKENPEFFKQCFKFFLCFTGLQVSYLTWGYMQVRLVATFSPTEGASCYSVERESDDPSNLPRCFPPGTHHDDSIQSHQAGSERALPIRGLLCLQQSFLSSHCGSRCGSTQTWSLLLTKHGPVMGLYSLRP